MRRDEQYVKQINALIPQAVLLADEKVRRMKKSRYKLVDSPIIGGGQFNYCMWSEYFHAAMKELAREAKLRK